jgi:hypothetical protein
LGIEVLFAERCLNHSPGGLVAIYDKRDYISERRKGLESWSAKFSSLEKGDAFYVIPIKRAVKD